MVLHKRENRDHLRMRTNNAPVRVREERDGTGWVEAGLDDLSATGLSLRLSLESTFPVGTVLLVETPPDLGIATPLNARAEVVHHQNEAGECVIGCRVLAFL
ncbi:MAG: PilZ domain-containing protein [Halothiobacillaceae bacterium]